MEERTVTKEEQSLEELKTFFQELNEKEDESALKLYIELKKEHQKLESQLDRLKLAAFEEAGNLLRGETKGKLFGAHIEMKWRKVWQYSEECEKRKEQLDALKKYEEKAGVAKLQGTNGYLTVSFKEISR